MARHWIRTRQTASKQLMMELMATKPAKTCEKNDETCENNDECCENDDETCEITSLVTGGSSRKAGQDIVDKQMNPVNANSYLFTTECFWFVKQTDYTPNCMIYDYITIPHHNLCLMQWRILGKSA